MPNSIDAARDDLRIGLTPEFLFEEYIVKDRGLEEIADQFSIGIKKLRGALNRAGIKKSADQFLSKSAKISKERYAIHGSNFSKLTLEERRTNQIKGVEARRANKLKQLQDQGFTEERLRRLYIDENRSLKDLQKHLNLTKKVLRNILKLYGIVKAQEHRDSVRSANLGAFYEDSESVETMILKRNITMGERYGRSWYRKTTSKEENSLRDAIAERYPELKLVQSDWSMIRRVSNNAQLQLDLLFPEHGIAIEYNGEFYHDRDRYEASLRGECSSPELEKTELCNDQGIKLIHVWSSDWRSDPDCILAMIAEEIKSLDERYRTDGSEATTAHIQL